MKEKMRFEEFKVAVVDGIKEWLPEQFATAHVSLQVVRKNNDLRLTGLTIQRVDSNIAPCIYLEGFFEKYQEGAEFTEVLSNIASIRLQHEVGEFDASQITEFTNCNDKILPRLVGASWNKDLLELRPHVLIEDLAVTFVVDLGKKDDGFITIPVTNELMDGWHLSVDELYEIAVNNLASKKEGTFSSMNEVVAKLMLPDFMETCDGDLDAVEEMLERMDAPSIDMWILSNKDNMFGASMLLDKNLMQKVIDKVGTKFYILPSSVHECIIVPFREDVMPIDLVLLVREVNESSVAEVDRLSENVYTYSIDEGIKLA